MFRQSLVTALLAACYASAADLRFGCSQLVVERSDPIVQPGILPSAHVHQIVGGNAFNSTVSPCPDCSIHVYHKLTVLDDPCGLRPGQALYLHVLSIRPRPQQLLDCVSLFQVSRERHVQDGPAKSQLAAHWEHRATSPEGRPHSLLHARLWWKEYQDNFLQAGTFA